MKLIWIAICLITITICHEPILRAQAPAVSAYSRSGLDNTWRTQVPAIRSSDQPPLISIFVSPDQTRTVYEVLDGPQRTVFTGPDAEHKADIRHRVLLMSGEKDTSIETRSVPLVSMLVQTFSGRVELIDAETGVRRWSIGLGENNAAEFPAAMDDHYVVAINGTTLYQIETASGKLVHQRPLTSAPGAGPVIRQSLAIVPSMQGAFKVYSMDQEQRDLSPKVMTSFGRVRLQPIVFPTGIVWSTTEGSIFLADPVTVETKFQVVGRSPVVGQPSIQIAETREQPDRLFAAYENGYLVCVDAENGNTLWAFLANASLASSPLVADDLVLVSTVDGRLYAVDCETGVERWNISGIDRAGAHAQGTVFCESLDGRLLMLDSRMGGLRGSLPLGDSEHLVENRVSDRVYLASASGSIRCFRKPEAKWPTIYVPLAASANAESTAALTASDALKPEKEALQPKVTEQPEATKPMGQPEEDPLGAEDDPFAAGADDPFAAGDDPF